MEELHAYLHRCDDPAHLKNYTKASAGGWSALAAVSAA